MQQFSKRNKQQVCDDFIARLISRGDVRMEADYLDSLKQHFQRLPTRYAQVVNIDSLDVISHQRLLEAARADPTTVSFAVRSVEVVGRCSFDSADPLPPPPLQPGESATISVPQRTSSLPRPAFGSSPNLQALALHMGERQESLGAASDGLADAATFYEITIASVDQPKLLSRLSEALSDLGLNIRECHAFNTSDGYSLDVFVANEWLRQDPSASLEELLGQRLLQMPPPPAPSGGSFNLAQRLPVDPLPRLQVEALARPDSPMAAADDWEIDIAQLQIYAKIASGAFSNLYKGSYCGQEVAVKILKDVQDDTSQFQEFVQEVSIMRKVRHKNVVQFIGACTRKPNLCIVFEYMSGGSVFDFMRRDGPLKLPAVLKVAAEVARGMDYLHQRKIIHRDLKAANLLMDETNVSKIADFGVARVLETSGTMTTETGTYRWMAPEVIEHKPYDEKADVFSFAIVLWELLTCKVPYNDMTPLQAAVGVVQKGLRPGIPANCPPALAAVMVACWDISPQVRPSFGELAPRLQMMYDAARDDEARKVALAAVASAKPSGGGLLAKLRGKG